MQRHFSRSDQALSEFGPALRTKISTEIVRNFASWKLPVFWAGKIFPYKSRGLVLVRPLAHNIVHSFCAEWVIYPRCSLCTSNFVPMRNFYAEQKCSFRSMICLCPSGLANNLINRICEEPTTVDFCACIVFAHENNSLLHQSLNVASWSLLTILSTENVKNRTDHRLVNSAENLRNVIIPLGIMYLDGKGGVCSQSFPQNM